MRAPKTKCFHCGNQTKKNASKYCSIRCQKDFEWELKCELVEQLGYFPFSYDGNIRAARRYLREKFKGTCSICGLNSWMGEPIPVVADHIDGNPTNWWLTNMRLICCNCDAQTDTYKGKNKGNGRHFRRQRYAEGKSF